MTCLTSKLPVGAKLIRQTDHNAADLADDSNEKSRSLWHLSLIVGGLGNVLLNPMNTITETDEQAIGLRLRAHPDKDFLTS